MRKLQSTYINPCVVNVLYLCCVVKKPNLFKRKLKKQRKTLNR